MARRLLELVHRAAAVLLERHAWRPGCCAPRRSARRRHLRAGLTAARRDGSRDVGHAGARGGLPVGGGVPRVIAEIDVAHQAQAEIWGEGGFGVHPDSRRGAIAALSAATEVLVQDRLWEVMPRPRGSASAARSRTSAASTALIYGEGDHFAAHSDGGGDDDAPVEVRRRRVSLVARAERRREREFTGGELEFYAGDVPAVAARHAAAAQRCAASRACSSPSARR